MAGFRLRHIAIYINSTVVDQVGCEKARLPHSRADAILSQSSLGLKEASFAEKGRTAEGVVESSLAMTPVDLFLADLDILSALVATIRI